MHIHVDYPKGLANMKHLYVIGNGFDIAHKILSRYSDFRHWLEENNPEVYDLMVEYFPDVAEDNVEWWSDFENNLDTVSAHDAIYRTASENYPNFGSDDFRDADYHVAAFCMEEEILKLYRSIQESFELWVQQISLPKGGLRMILPHDAFYLTFNYTDTLEDYYNISPDNILHIHGRESIGDQLIFGHAGNSEHISSGTEMDIPNPPESLDEDELEQWFENNADDYIVSSTRSSAQKAILEFKKPTEEIIEKCRIFFGCCRDLETITIYGLSFSPVDMPYLQQIVSHCDLHNVHWYIFYYSEKDYNSIVGALESLKIPLNKTSIIKSSEFPNSINIQPTIPGL